jgi:hypothetical protein
LFRSGSEFDIYGDSCKAIAASEYRAGGERRGLVHPRRVDPGSGTAWVHCDGTMTLAGDHQLADHLAELAGRWDAAGRPAAGDWLVDWRHADTGGAGLLLPYQWRQATRPGESLATGMRPATES